VIAHRNVVSKPTLRCNVGCVIREDVCRSLGITPNLVRVWRCRTQANTDIRHLLGEQPAKPGEKQADSASETRRDLADLCQAVLYGPEERAEQMAMALVECYGF
jgi:hypothetical protein